jgi:CDP-diacylglycerol--glycerol-3-phosphate 3-phosphatidyltransferase
MLRPIVGHLARFGVTANQVTVTACALSLFAGALLPFAPRQALLVIPPFLLLRMAMNAVDGMLAREHGQASPLGAILNELADVVSDAALALPFALLPGWNALAVAAAVLLGMLVEMAGTLGVNIGASRRYDGPFGKSDRAFAYSALAIWVALDPSGGQALSVPLPAAFCALSVWTILNRIRGALAEVSRPAGARSIGG